MRRIGSRVVPGFTLIELVIALAIAIVIITSVYAVTNAMTAMAKRQKQNSILHNKRERFLEILTRDLRGWIAATGGNDKPNSGTDDKNVLFTFDTTADGLGQIVTTDGTMVPRLTQRLQYLIQETDGETEIRRVETISKSQSFPLTVFRSASAPKIEFFDGRNWQTNQSKARPAAVRLMIDGQTIYISLD